MSKDKIVLQLTLYFSKSNMSQVLELDNDIYKKCVGYCSKVHSSSIFHAVSVDILAVVCR